MKREHSTKLKALIVQEKVKNPDVGPKQLVKIVKATYPEFDLLSDEKLREKIYYLLATIEEDNKPSINFVQVVGEQTTTSSTFTSTSASYDYVSFAQTPTVVGIIADTHEPFTHPGYRDFCEYTFNKYGVSRIVHIGDEADNYFLSYHEKDPNFLNYEKETERAMANMREWYKVFPNVDVMVGNHGALPFRKATTIGLPKKWLKTYEEYWESPTGWKWHQDIEIDNVKYTHGLGSSGQTGAIDRAIRSRQSTVIGHIHAFAGVNYHASNNDLIFGMNVGCGIDAKAYAFEYGKDFNNKPVVGCGIVINGEQAIFVPMNLGSKYTWK
jgi:predicted phosphodiesterase